MIKTPLNTKRDTINKIQKRDGKLQEFLSFKITDAIKKAFKSENSPYDDRVFTNVIKKIKNQKIVDVENIQDLIERELFSLGYFKIMRSFMLYRHLHKMQR